MYSAFLYAQIHFEEIDFSIISAFKSQVSPVIAFHCIVKVSSHFPVFVTHVFCIFNSVYILGYFCVHLLQFNNNITQFVIVFSWQYRIVLVDGCSGIAPVAC